MVIPECPADTQGSQWRGYVKASMTEMTVTYMGQWRLSRVQQAVASVVFQAVNLSSHFKHTGEKLHPKNGMEYWKISSMTIRSGEELKPRFIGVGFPASAATVPQS